MKELTLMHFGNTIEMRKHLSKLKKTDKSAKILKSGKGRTRCRGAYVWAFFEITSEKNPLESLPVDYQGERYFYSEEDRDKFIQTKLNYSNYTIVNLGQLSKNNWYKVGELYYVTFSNLK